MTMRVAVTTMGCKVNQYDTAVMRKLFGDKGWREVPFDAEADAYVVNSCTVTDRADAEARRLARRARRRNPRARVIMTGCYAQVDATSIADFDYVDHVIGLGRLGDVLQAIEGEMLERTAVSDLRHATEVATLGISTFSGRTRAFVKVQEGCNLFCTFCIVPVARGRSRSVPARTVLAEMERLQADGYREVVLTGVHLGGYGDDLEPRVDLAWLLEAIAERDLDLRVRVSSVDPPEITDRFIDVLSSWPGFCPHFHVPLQAGTDSVLDRMRRVYSTAEAAQAIARLRRAMPEVAIGTDLITGFPGETAQEFEQGLAWVESMELSYLHVFPYSRRSATSAAKRWEPLEDSLVHERARRMRALDATLRRRWRARHLGDTVEALFENTRCPETGLLKGYSHNYLPLVCDGGDELMNRFLDVRVVAEADGRLVAQPV